MGFSSDIALRRIDSLPLRDRHSSSSSSPKSSLTFCLAANNALRPGGVASYILRELFPVRSLVERK